MQPGRLEGSDAPTELNPSPPVHETERLGSSPATRQQLEAGALLLGRFRIVRMLGQGGMGEVYEAADVALGTRVALKTVRLEESASESALHRFRREILLARKIAHPNVCKVFELHVGGPGEPPVFLSMELLEGETLTARLRREGRIEEDVARGIVLQIAAGLGAAHAEGVVHRDLKSSNVMLVPVRGGGERAVVTDFGIARAVGGLSDGTATLEGPIGTPAYMAPEQVTGGEVTAATDLYCLGVLMYELTTGALPFRGETPAQIAYRRLGAEAPDPSEANPGLSKVWSSLVRWCLESEPAKRPQTAEAFLQPLEGKRRPPRRLTRARWLAVGLALAFAAAAVPLTGRLRSHRGTFAPAIRPVAAVLEAENQTGDAGLDWLSTAFSEAFASSLEPIRGLRIVPPRIVADRQFSLGVSTASPQGASDGTRRVAESVGARDLVELRFERDKPGQLLFQAMVRSATRQRGLYEASFKPDAKASEVGSPEEVEAIAARLAESVRSQLRWERGAPESRSPLIPAPALPRDPEARRLYAQALRQVARYDAPGALSLVRRAQQREPSFLPAMTLRRYDVVAFVGAQFPEWDLFERGRTTIDALPATSPERQWVEAVSPEALWKTGEAPQRLKSLLGRSPDDFDLALVTAAVSPDVIQQLATLRARPPPLGTDPRIDLVEAIARLEGEPPEASAAFEHGLAEARRRGDHLLVSLLLAPRGVLEAKEGRIDEGVKSFLEAEREALAGGSSSLARQHRFGRATTLNEAGRLKAAGQLFHQLLTELRGLDGWEQRYKQDLRQLAEIETLLGHPEVVHALTVEAKNPPGFRVLHHWDIKRSDNAAQREEAHRQEIGACEGPQCVWLWTTWLGMELVAQGRPADALKPLAETGRIVDSWEQVALYAQAMTDLGRAAEAYPTVRAKVRDDVRTRGTIASYEAWRANHALAICLLGMHELDEAARVIARMTPFHRSWDDVEGRAIGLGLEAQLALAQGTVAPELRARLRAQLDEPEMRAFPRTRAELKMELGRVLLATGKSREGRRLLSEADRESTARGELRTARLARAAVEERPAPMRAPPRTAAQ